MALNTTIKNDSIVLNNFETNQSRPLGKSKKVCTTLEDYSNFSNLEEVLDSLIGKKLFKEEQKELIKKIDVRVNRKQQRSRKKLNDGLEMLKLPYIILPKKSNDMRYWVIEKIDI